MTPACDHWIIAVSVADFNEGAVPGGRIECRSFVMQGTLTQAGAAATKYLESWMAAPFGTMKLLEKVQRSSSVSITCWVPS